MMDSLTIPRNLLYYFQHLLVLCFVLMLPDIVNTSKFDHNHLLIYNHCENQTSVDHHPDSVSLILSQLFQELQEKSSTSKFFQTNAGDDKIAVSGLFQCRGDLSNDDCYSCVNKLPEVSSRLCGASLPARVQLAGCRMNYQAEGVHTTRRLQLLHKTCSLEQGLYGFQEKRDAAFVAVQECILSSPNQYCDQICESVHVMAQCDGNLGECDCGKCVTTAINIVQEECGYSLAGEVYLEGCSLSYGYQEHGIVGYDGGRFGGSSTKIVAIVIGGIAAVVLGAGLCYICRGGRHKDGK
ncbi:OLC1v1025883C2 [Oldenlandia corymbosa var. corymbosa]|uniref:OLC1v1025883C2 n=1 Tax=Oldenlandia corymbosa var. corymbosa TaxID=529605 RepID=A0AAV1C962_OLDCO|nr:OLC1v1025883C2 [Oldenlandia corymbosa var. corymbosa]